MGRLSLGQRAIALAFLWLCISEGSLATRKEDLERAAELAVERAAERAAERAVEKALESGNSTTESETIRESYSSVRKYNKSLQLPRTGYTPAQRRDYDRIVREREAAERASALLKRSIDNERVDDHHQLAVSNVDQMAKHQHQGRYYENLPESVSPETLWRLHAARQLPFQVKDHMNYDKDVAANYRNNRQTLPSVGAHSVQEDYQFASSYPAKVYPIQTMEQHQPQFYVVPVTAPASRTVFATYPHYADHQGPRVANVEDYSGVRDNGHSYGRGRVYR